MKESAIHSSKMLNKPIRFFGVPPLLTIALFFSPLIALIVINRWLAIGVAMLNICIFSFLKNKHKKGEENFLRTWSVKNKIRNKTFVDKHHYFDFL